MNQNPPPPPLGATPEPSATPRTDAAERSLESWQINCDDNVCLVSAKVARTLETELATARAALAQCEEKCEELSEMVETADADAAKHYEDIHKESMAAVEAIRTAEGWGDGVFASVRERIWWIAATRTIDSLRAARRDEESWWKEKHDYQARAESAESALSLLTAKLAQWEEKLAKASSTK